MLTQQILFQLIVILLVIQIFGYLCKRIGQQWVIGEILAGLLFLPLYFVYTGLRTQIGLLNSPWLWFICLALLVLACAGKIFGAAFSMHFLGETWRDAFNLGTLMNTRGLVELIVLNIGLDLGILSPTLFTMLVIMALVTTMMASPLLASLARILPPSPANSGDQVQDVINVAREEY